MRIDFQNNFPNSFLLFKISENVLICKTCTERIDSFGQFYDEIHKAKQKMEEQQSEEIRYIILLDDNKTAINLKDLDESSQDQQLAIVDFPVSDVQSFEETIQQSETLQPPQIVPEQVVEEQTIESNLKQTEMLGANFEDFPKELIKDGKLIIKGKELSKLIAKFYRLECSICPTPKKFKKFTVMINHFKTEHSAKGFVACCGRKISKIRQIAMHMARHIQPEAFRCHECSKLLTCPKILQYHIQNHLPEHERTLACSEPGCKRKFSYQSALATHLVSHLPENERTTFGCETCGRRFSSSGRLNAHINMIHTKSNARKEFACEVCSKVFLCKSNLTYHLTTHKNFEFQVECTICNKWLKNKICLRKHMHTIHSAVRHFCDICEYSAANKQCLMNHKKVQHSDSKPFSCEVRNCVCL